MNIDVRCYPSFFCNTVTVHYPFDSRARSRFQCEESF
jgi:hypothetical protein